MRMLVIGLIVSLSATIGNSAELDTRRGLEPDHEDRASTIPGFEGLAKLDEDGRCHYVTPGRMSHSVSCVHELTQSRLANVLLLTLIDAGEALAEGYISEEDYGSLVEITLATYRTYKGSFQDKRVERVEKAFDFYEDALADSGVDATYLPSPRTALFETNLFMEFGRVRRLRGQEFNLPK